MVKKLVDAVECIIAYIFNQIFEFVEIFRGELSGVWVDDIDEVVSGVLVELVEWL